MLVAALEWPTHVDGISNLAHKIVDLTDCRALVVLVEMEERVFAVVRSRTPELDAAELARALGGGGHAQAASAILRGSLAEARAALDEGLRATAAQITAREIMSKPVRSVGPDETVAHAMVTCQRYGQSGILVLEDGRLVGSVAREDLDKAVGHGLSHAPVKGIMSSRVARCDRTRRSPRCSALVEVRGAGRGASRATSVVGVVTRSDVLAALGARARARGGGARAGSARPSSSGWRSWRPPSRRSRRSARRYEGVYLVGGTVRDILLGEQSFDVDIAVEGDAIELAKALAEALDGRVRPHEKFGTAVVLYGDGGRIDVVTTRTEFYDAPAALPTVEHATIREDLFRRDFTINAMAVSLKGDDLGRLVDPFGGRADLDAGVIRVLHNLSFIDDPTRIFRAIRYENRYGFRMDEHTARLARSCDRDGARRRPLVGSPPRRARAAALRGRRAPLDPAPGRARRRPRDPPAPRRRRGGGGALRSPRGAGAASTASRFRPGGSGCSPSRGSCRPTSSTTGSTG